MRSRSTHSLQSATTVMKSPSGAGVKVVQSSCSRRDTLLQGSPTSRVSRCGERRRRDQVCTYDRAGQGTSGEAPPGPRDADDVVRDLRDLLTAAELEPPFVMVGSSFGGMIVTHFAATHPSDVAGVVLLDVPAPAVLDPAELPELAWNHSSNTEHLDIIHGFEGRFARERAPFPAPLVVVTATDGQSDVTNQAIWLELSPNAEQVELEGGHDIHHDDPSRVARVILELV